MGENITPKHLDDIFDALPEEMDAAELSALTLTLHSAFIENPVEIITNLIASIYTYGETQGISYEKISEGLRASADVHSTQKTAH